MIPRRAVEQYQSVRIETAQPGQVIVMLYDGLFRLLADAERAIAARDPKAKGEKLSRVLAILGELQASLDHGVAPELCANLDALYSFCMDRVTEANVRFDAEPLAAVHRTLAPLRAAWAEAIRTPQAPPPSPAAEAHAP